MKKSPNMLIIVTIFFVLYIFVVYSTSSAAGLNQPAYTVFSARGDGVSLLYDTLAHMKYPVSISFTKVTGHIGKQDVQIIMYPDHNYFTDVDKNEMLEWVEAGGRAIYFERNDFFSPIHGDSPLGREADGPFTLYDYGYGQIVICNSEIMTNENLTDSAAVGDVLCGILNKWDYDKIYFNEYYHGFQQNPTMWKNIPRNFKLLVYQLVLTVLFIVWFFGKRFGKPVPYYEEIERGENEYLKSLSTLYEKAGMGEIAVESYYNNFLRSCCKFFNKNIDEVRENVLTYWKQSNLPHYELLKETLDEINFREKYSLKNKSGRKKFMKIIRNVKTLTHEINHTV